MADESFKEFVLDQLSALPELRARAMFGAHGLYQADRFFGILDEGRLYFRVTEQSRAAFRFLCGSTVPQLTIVAACRTTRRCLACAQASGVDNM